MYVDFLKDEATLKIVIKHFLHETTIFRTVFLFPSITDFIRGQEIFHLLRVCKQRVYL